MREVGLNTLSHLPEDDRERFDIFLIGARRGFKPDVGRLEQVELNHDTDIPLVANDAAVVVFHPDIVQIVDVVDVGCRDVVGVEHPAHPRQSMELIAVVVLPL